MVETKRDSEQDLVRDLVFFGQDPGGKVEGLVDLRQRNLEGIQVLGGVSLGASFFREFLEENGLTFESSQGSIKSGEETPESLENVSRDVLKTFPSNYPIAVRSSAGEEFGGRGVYSSRFFIPKGDEQGDLRRFLYDQIMVYGSYGTKGARLLRELREGSEELGMGLLVQPVIGETFGDYILPNISGVMTAYQGEPYLRLALGLGTAVVNTDEYGGCIRVFNGDEVEMGGIEQESSLLISEAHAINLNYVGVLSVIDTTDEMRGMAMEQMSKLERLIEVWRGEFEKGVPYYWEFAICESHEDPLILQSHIKDKRDVYVGELGEPEGIVAWESTDLLNTGIREGKKIVMLSVRSVKSGGLDELEEFNRNNRDFLLIVPDAVLTSRGRPDDKADLRFEHFSNALVVVEQQYNRDYGSHVGTLERTNIGGSHFAEICWQEEILFQGVPDHSEADFIIKFSRAKKMFGEHILVWDVDFYAINTKNAGRVEILGEE